METLPEILALKSLRINPAETEHAIHRAIKSVLSENGISFFYERDLAPRCRIDFLTKNGVGIEVKKGKPNSSQVSRQIDRYCSSDDVLAIVLVVERNIWCLPNPPKPVYYVSLSTNWGIAL